MVPANKCFCIDLMISCSEQYNLHIAGYERIGHNGNECTYGNKEGQGLLYDLISKPNSADNRRNGSNNGKGLSLSRTKTKSASNV